MDKNGAREREIEREREREREMRERERERRERHIVGESIIEWLHCGRITPGHLTCLWYAFSRLLTMTPLSFVKRSPPGLLDMFDMLERALSIPPPPR